MGAELAEILARVGQELRTDGLNAGYGLRKLQSALLLVLKNRCDEKLDFFCFFVSNFVDDIYYNLSGDFFYQEISYEIIGTIFKELGTCLGEASEHIKQRRHDHLNLIYEKMVKSYLDGLERIDKFFKSTTENSKN